MENDMQICATYKFRFDGFDESQRQRRKAIGISTQQKGKKSENACTYEAKANELVMFFFVGDTNNIAPIP